MEYWSRGITLPTKITEKWSEDQWKENNSIERSMIFSDFHVLDGGKSRKLVAHVNVENPDYEKNANLITAAPAHHSALKKIRKLCVENGMRFSDIWRLCNDAIKEVENA